MIAASRRFGARSRTLAVIGTCTGLALAGLPLAAAVAPTPIPYVEQSDPVAVGQDLAVSDPGPYDGKTVDFAVTGADSSDVLTLRQDSAPSTVAGEVTVVGDVVYLGDGSTAVQIGTVDSVLDGTGGQTLRVNFVSEFANAGFETGDLTGWTALLQQIDLGVTSIDGHQTVDTSTYPSNTTNQDNNAPTYATYTATVQSNDVSTGSYALQLSSSMTTAVGCDVVHGPAVYSSPFTASAGDVISFDWRAIYGGDDYHVFGYIVDQDGNQTELLDDTGTTTSWATTTTTIPADGTYSFVFVAGTHDLTCGTAAGASLLIDNVKVYGQRVTAEVVQQVAQHLMYSSTTDQPAATRTVTMTATTQTGGTATSASVVAIQPVDDAPSISGVSNIPLLTNIEGTQTYSTVTGTIDASDPDGDTLTYGVVGGVATTTTIDGQTYTVARTSTFGTLYVDAATGRYAFVPSAAAVDAQQTGTTDQLTVTATAAGVVVSTPLQVVVTVPPSVPSAPGTPTATAGDRQATLTWSAPAWTGGSAVTGYQIERSDDGGATWTVVVASTGSAATSATVTGLTGGATTLFRVAAINATGTGSAGATVSVTAYAPASAPTIQSVTGGPHRLTVAFSAPTDVRGSAVTGYEYSLDGGATWTAATGTTSPLVLRGLDNGTAYSVQLRAVNAAGGGDASAAVVGTPVLAPVETTSVDGSTARPSVPAGESWLVVDDVRQPVTVSTADGAWSVTGDGFTAVLQALEEDGSPLAVDAAGRLVVHASGELSVSGTGFRPGSTVDVWLFSTPYLLGEVTVGADGSFAATFALPADVETGAHTVQLNGVGTDGSVRSLSTGVVVLADAAATPLATTGTESVPLGLLAVILVGVGVLALRVRRLVVRRRGVVTA